MDFSRAKVQKLDFWYLDGLSIVEIGRKIKKTILKIKIINSKYWLFEIYFLILQYKQYIELMFDEICSIYESAQDAYGRFVDRETGECIREMSIRDFCLTDRWQPYVEHLRAMRQEYGDKAKKMAEYVETKKMLPGATLSGRFALYEDESLTHPGQRVMVSRRETHLQQHTGWLAIDIDLADNTHLSNFENVRMVARFRPEIALLMRSCSGTGYFGLVRLAYPDRHKEQFKALLKEYAGIGITLDKQCGNIGRVRFASWDAREHIYINEKAVAYKGLDVEAPRIVPRPQNVYDGYHRTTDNTARPYDRSAASAFWDEPRAHDRLIELLVKELVSRRVNITESYEDWCKAGWALKGHPYGERLFHELSACSRKYNAANTAHKWQQLGQSTTVTGNYLIHACKQCLSVDEYRAICRRVWEELK